MILFHFLPISDVTGRNLHFQRLGVAVSFHPVTEVLVRRFPECDNLVIALAEIAVEQGYNSFADLKLVCPPYYSTS